jgi:hypothetical protein
MSAILSVGLVFAETMALLLVSAHVGHLFGRRHREKSDPEARSQVGIVEGALLGLLALLMGFTFAMAVSRFEQRQSLVLREANDLGTAYLRCDFLPGDQQSLARAKLREYADARVTIAFAGVELSQIDESVRHVGRLQADLWAMARDEAKARPGPGIMSLVTALNALFDTGEARRAALDNTVPGSVWVVLYLVAFLTAGSLGFGSGLAGRRMLLPVILVPALLGILLTLLVDLDHPRHGLIHTSQESMIRARDAMK